MTTYFDDHEIPLQRIAAGIHGRRAFRDSPDLLSVTVAEGVQTVDSYAFYHCENLEAVSLPASLKKINEPDPSFFYFRYMDRSQITVTVPNGTKALYESHWLWSTCGAIVERLE